MTSYRTLIQKDLKNYKELRLLSLLESPFSFSDSLDDLIDKRDDHFMEEMGSGVDTNDHFMMGAFKKEELVGFVNFKRDIRTKAKHKGMIHRTYIHPNYRNQNIGFELICSLLQFLVDLKGLEQIHLWVLDPKNNTSKFYEKLGFESQGAVVKKDLKINDEYIDAEYMVLYLK